MLRTLNMEDVIPFVTRFLNRKERCRIRATSKELRDLVEKPRPMKQLRTHPFAKIKMLLNLGKSIGYTRVEMIDDLKHVVVCYKDRSFEYHRMKEFHFMRTPVARMFFMAYKFREFDSKMIPRHESFQYKYQLKPRRAKKLLAATPKELESIRFLVTS